MPRAPDEPRAVVEVVRDDRRVVLGPVPASARGDLAVVEDLLRLSMALARLGWRMRLVEPRAELLELVTLLGLAEQVCGGTGAAATRPAGGPTR